MNNKLEEFNKSLTRTDIPDVRPGDTVKIYQKLKEGEKRRKVQTFEGTVLSKKHGKGASATITVRRIVLGVGTEMIFPLHSPNIEKMEILKRGKVRRAKLYYLKGAKGRKARLKRKELKGAIVTENNQAETPAEEVAENK